MWFACYNAVALPPWQVPLHENTIKATSIMQGMRSCWRPHFFNVEHKPLHLLGTTVRGQCIWALRHSATVTGIAAEHCHCTWVLSDCAAATSRGSMPPDGSAHVIPILEVVWYDRGLQDPGNRELGSFASAQGSTPAYPMRQWIKTATLSLTFPPATHKPNLHTLHAPLSGNPSPAALCAAAPLPAGCSAEASEVRHNRRSALHV